MEDRIETWVPMEMGMVLLSLRVQVAEVLLEVIMPAEGVAAVVLMGPSYQVGEAVEAMVQMDYRVKDPYLHYVGIVRLHQEV
jgi:hypothetical protein